MSLSAYLASCHYAEHVAGRHNDVRTEFGELCSWRCYGVMTLFREDASREE